MVVKKISSQECVKREASRSIQMTRNISEKEANSVIDGVFDRCYNDLEPFGKPIRSYEDYKSVYANRFKYGYK